MNANEMTFGIEIECMVPVSRLSEFNGRSYRNGTSIPGFSGWQAKSDSSIRPEVGFAAVEVVSPVLRGMEGLHDVVMMVDHLNAIGAKVNSSCGLHVHVGAQHMETSAIERLTKLFTRFERAFYAQSGEEAQARFSNYYCKNSSQWDGSRYASLNLTNLNTGGWRSEALGTVEVRCFAGTLSDAKIVSAIYLSVGLVAYADNIPGVKLGRRIEDTRKAYRILTNNLARHAGKCFIVPDMDPYHEDDVVETEIVSPACIAMGC